VTQVDCRRILESIHFREQCNQFVFVNSAINSYSRTVQLVLTSKRIYLEVGLPLAPQLGKEFGM
jgi:hypothetical protein